MSTEKARVYIKSIYLDDEKWWLVESFDDVGDSLDYLMDDIGFNSTRDTKYPYCILTSNKSHHQHHKMDAMQLDEFKEYFLKPWVNSRWNTWLLFYLMPGVAGTNDTIESFNKLQKNFFNVFKTLCDTKVF